jgi:hypothetical protein
MRPSTPNVAAVSGAGSVGRSGSAVVLIAVDADCGRSRVVPPRGRKDPSQETPPDAAARIYEKARA